MAKQKTIQVQNKSKLPVIDYKQLTDFQGTLKTIDKTSLDKLKRSIIKYGFSFPAAVWVSKGKTYIIDSHQRKLALSELEAEGYLIPPIPYYEIQAKDKAEAKKKLLLINSKYGKITEEGFIDFVSDIDFDDIIGDLDIPEIDLDNVLIELSGKEEIEDDIPEVDEKEVVIKLGDLIELGKHRLLCNDCTVKENVDKLMKGNKADMVITSPPYAEQRKNNYNSIPIKDYIQWFLKVINNINVKHFFLNIKEHVNKGTRETYVIELVLNIIKTEWNWIDEFIWYKPGIPGKYKYRCRDRFERIYHFSKEIKFEWNPKKIGHKSNDMVKTIKKKNKIGDNRELIQATTTTGIAHPSNVIKLGANHEFTGHSAMYPVKLPEFFIKGWSNNIVIDPFLGSGSSLIACEKTERMLYGIELSEWYCQVIIERYLNYTDTNKVKINGQEYIWETYKRKRL